MDAQRSRRTKDHARQAWYAYYRQVRFARWFGFIDSGGDWSQNYRGSAFRVAGVATAPRANPS